MTIFDSDIIDNVIKKLSNKVRMNKKTINDLPKFVFVCGKSIFDGNGNLKDSITLEEEENKRNSIIEKFNNSNVKCVISEKLYNNESVIDTLTFEELLAELSDDIIIIVESPGTFCELGAFTVKDKYIKKLFVINDREREHDKSFINEGPGSKLRQFNSERYIFVNYGNYEEFKINKDILNYIEFIKSKSVKFIPNHDEKKIDLKNLIYELLSIIEIFQPINKEELFKIYVKLKSFNGYNIKNREKHMINSPSSIINLMNDMQLICVNNGYISKHLDETYNYYNVMFKLNRYQFNNIRSKVMFEIYNNHIDRLGDVTNDYIRVNE